MAKLTNWYPDFDASGNFRCCTSWENILREIFTVLVTRPGTRQWNPQFGCKLLDLLFEYGVQENQFVEVIREAFIKWLPHVDLDSISCTLSKMPDTIGQKASVKLKISYGGESKTIGFDIPPHMDLLNGAVHQINITKKPGYLNK